MNNIIENNLNSVKFFISSIDEINDKLSKIEKYIRRRSAQLLYKYPPNLECILSMDSQCERSEKLEDDLEAFYNNISLNNEKSLIYLRIHNSGKNFIAEYRKICKEKNNLLRKVLDLEYEYNLAINKKIKLNKDLVELSEKYIDYMKNIYFNFKDLYQIAIIQAYQLYSVDTPNQDKDMDENSLIDLEKQIYRS